MKYVRDWIYGWSLLLEGLAIIISFGSWYPNWSFKVMFWKAMKNAEDYENRKSL